jgi:hypothetical protein
MLINNSCVGIKLSFRRYDAGQASSTDAQLLCHSVHAVEPLNSGTQSRIMHFTVCLGCNCSHYPNALFFTKLYFSV